MASASIAPICGCKTRTGWFASWKQASAAARTTANRSRCAASSATSPPSTSVNGDWRCSSRSAKSWGVDHLRRALPAMLESLGTNLGFDMAGLWFVSSDHHGIWRAGTLRTGRVLKFHRDSIGGVLQKARTCLARYGLPKPLLDQAAGEQQLSARQIRPGGRPECRLGRSRSRRQPGDRRGRVLQPPEAAGRSRDDGHGRHGVRIAWALHGALGAREPPGGVKPPEGIDPSTRLRTASFGTDSAGRIVFVNPAAWLCWSAHAFDPDQPYRSSVVHEERKGRRKVFGSMPHRSARFLVR